MPQPSARQYDAHYRRLGLAPGSSPAKIEAAARNLRSKLQPERLNDGPLKDIAPIRMAEIAESEALLLGYWQQHSIAPPSIQNRQTLPVLVSSPGAQRMLLLPATINETEITNTSQVSRLGPQVPRLSFTFFLFKTVDGAVSPNSDLMKTRSIVGLISLAIIWITIPYVLVYAISYPFKDLGLLWLNCLITVARVLPVCFVPPLVMYEYAFFRQLQFPFAGAIRLPVDRALQEIVVRLTVAGIGNKAGWTIEKQALFRGEKDSLSAEILAVYTGYDIESKLPLKMHIRLEELSKDSSFLVYWFELDWKVLFKGRAVSRMKWARFELDSLIKSN